MVDKEGKNSNYKYLFCYHYQYSTLIEVIDFIIVMTILLHYIFKLHSKNVFKNMVRLCLSFIFY